MTSPPDSTEQRHLDELLAAMRGPCEATFPASPDAETQAAEMGLPSDPTFAPAATFLSPRFEKEFRTTLLIHHYFLRAPLARNSFEAAFVRAARTAGHDIRKAPAGQRFWDVELDGRQISLKSTAAADLRGRSLHISKLCEAAWIQDARSAARREDNAKRLFEEYTTAVDSIIQTAAVPEEGFLRNGEDPHISLGSSRGCSAFQVQAGRPVHWNTGWPRPPGLHVETR